MHRARIWLALGDLTKSVFIYDSDCFTVCETCLYMMEQLQNHCILITIQTNMLHVVFDVN